MILNNVELLRVVVKYIVLEIHCRTVCILSYVYVSILIMLSYSEWWCSILF